LLKSLRYAFNGIRLSFKEQRNIKLITFVGCLAIGYSIFLNIPKFQLLTIISISFLVIILEAINTSIEILIDFLYPKIHAEIKKTKDILAGSVLLASILAIIIGIFILYGPTISLFRN